MNLNSKTDEELMQLYQQGTEQAFETLYRRHSSKVLGFLISKLRNKEKAHDVFQNVFVKVHKSKHLYNKSLPFLPWLFTITQNILIDEIRKTSKEKLHMGIDDLELVATQVQSPNEMSQVTPYFEALPDGQKKAIELRYVEEKTFQEISKTLGTSEVNVRKLISRGVHRLKELLREGEGS